MSTEVYFVIISLLFSALFSGVEMAFISANKLQVELEKNQGHFSSKIVSIFYQNPSQFIATMLIGNTLALSVYAIFMADILNPFIRANAPAEINYDFPVFIIQTVLATIIVIFTAEYLPKSAFMIIPNRLLRIFALPTFVIYYALYIPVQIVVFISKTVIKGIFKIPFSDERPVFGLTDLNMYLEKFASKNANTEHEIDTKILNNALEFKSVKVKECMVPRTDIEAVDIDEGIAELEKTFIQTGYSKILIYKNSIDNIIGYCHSSEMFKKPESIREILNPLIVVPESFLANELLLKFISERKTLALVVDEFGGTAGIVTIEDVMEEIFGEIQDEHDDVEYTEKQIDDNVYLLSARLEIDYLNEKYGWNLPHGDYETIGGFILDIFEDIPLKDKVIAYKNFKFTIISKQKNRIETIKAEVLPHS